MLAPHVHDFPRQGDVKATLWLLPQMVRPLGGWSTAYLPELLYRPVYRYLLICADECVRSKVFLQIKTSNIVKVCRLGNVFEHVSAFASPPVLGGDRRYVTPISRYLAVPLKHRLILFPLSVLRLGHRGMWDILVLLVVRVLLEVDELFGLLDFVSIWLILRRAYVLLRVQRSSISIIGFVPMWSTSLPRAPHLGQRSLIFCPWLLNRLYIRQVIVRAFIDIELPISANVGYVDSLS